MSLPRLWLRLEAPHLEPLEPVLDILEGEEVAILLGPALQLAVGPGLVPALAASGFDCWLDLTLPADLADVDVWARLLTRSQAKGVVVGGETLLSEAGLPELAAVARLVEALGTRPLLLRSPPRFAAAHSGDGPLAGALRAMGVAALVTPSEGRQEQGAGTGRHLPQVDEGAAAAPAAFSAGHGGASAPPERYIDRHLARHADPPHYLAQLQSALRSVEA